MSDEYDVARRDDGWITGFRIAGSCGLPKFWPIALVNPFTCAGSGLAAGSENISRDHTDLEVSSPQFSILLRRPCEYIEDVRPIATEGDGVRGWS